MNVSDSEIVGRLLQESGYSPTSLVAQADVILLNTCAIRDRAEQRIRHRLRALRPYKARLPHLKVGILGCMAERLKAQLLAEEKIVDLIVGPDAYRRLPELLAQTEGGQAAIDVFLSREETYANIEPLRLNSNGITAFISIMRGCDNMCSFCVVPFTRGRERSRAADTIVAEAEGLFRKGYKDVTLLGQNVDSYRYSKVSFADLLVQVADIDPVLRVRFSTSHPKDITEDVLYAMKSRDNICKHIHLPAQSGSSAVLRRMNRCYDRARYLEVVASIRRILGDACSLSSDFIAGFCGETDQEHQGTLSLMDEVRYDSAYMFMYSERPGTRAARTMADDVPLAVKKKRLADIVQLQGQHALARNRALVGQTTRVLIEGRSKRSAVHLQGRNSQNKVVVFPHAPGLRAGHYTQLRILACTQATLKGIQIKDDAAKIAPMAQSDKVCA